MPPDDRDSPAGRADLVRFKTASSPLEAEVIAGVLRAADIPVYIEGSLLADEFAMSQRLMGLNAVRIQVPRDRVADAAAALAEARAASAEVDAAAAATAPPPETSRPEAAPRAGSRLRAWVLPAVLGATTLVFLVNWLETRAALRASLQSGATYLDRAASSDTALVYRWSSTGAVAFRCLDADRNGIPESIESYNLEGRPLQRARDRDQNGVAETVARLDGRGNVIGMAHDDDQDGVFERIEEERAGGRKVVWLDADQDGRTERLEERDGTTGPVRSWQWREDHGFELVK
jgi:hypothetical protein